MKQKNKQRNKQKNKWIALVLCTVLMCTMLSGCNEAEKPDKTEKEIQFVTVDDGNGMIQIEEAMAIADFSYELFRNTAAQESENLLISPLSAWLALSMSAQGADGETDAAFAKAFHNLSAEQLKHIAARLIQRIETQDTDVDMENSLWCDEKLTIEPMFQNTAEQYYNADVFLQDLQAGNAVRNINNWIADATGHQIKNMLKDIDKDALMLLVNTLTFDADWQWEFEANDTKQNIFYRANGREKNMEFMHRTYYDAAYYEWDGGRGMLLPYENGEYAMMVLLPHESSDYYAVMEKLSAEWINQLISETEQEAVVQLSMPKFEMNSGVMLNDVCRAMGMEAAFHPLHADFTKLGTSKNGDNIYINRVIQNCTLKVAEEGTEAAAATIVEMSDEAAIELEEMKILQLNRPFVYLILDMETQIPLFAGVYQGE